MSAELTPEQMDRAVLANRLQIYGFPGAARQIVDGLRRESGLSAHPPGAAEAPQRVPEHPRRASYGRFRLNEADECALGVVETPARTGGAR